MANLLLQHKRCWDQGEAVGKDDGTIPADQTKQRPDGHPTGEHAVHRKGNRARVIGAQRLDGLREKAQGGQRRGQVADCIHIHREHHWSGSTP